jgi:hypothetical protein
MRRLLSDETASARPSGNDGTRLAAGGLQSRPRAPHGKTIMHKTLLPLLAAAVAATLPLGAYADTMTPSQADAQKAQAKGDYKADKAQAKAEYDASRQECKDTSHGAAERACKKEAKAQEKQEKADAKTNYKEDKADIKGNTK